MRNWLLLGLLVSWLGICLSCDEREEELIASDDLLRIEAHVETGDSTKAVKSLWERGDQLGLFVKVGGSIMAPYYGGVSGQVVGQYSGSEWSLAPKVTLTESAAYVYAYYPYNSSVSDGRTIPIDIATNTDYLYGGNPVTASTARSSVALTMKHALTVLAFNIKRNGYIGNGLLTSVTIRNTSGYEIFVSEGKMNCATGIISSTAYDSYTITTSKTITETGWSESLPMAMVIPFNTLSPSGVEVVFVVDGNQYVVTVPINKEFLSGQKYVLNLTINSSDLNVDDENITILPWGTDGSVNLSDTMTKVRGVGFTVGTTSSGYVFTVPSIGSAVGTVSWGDNTTSTYSPGLTHTYVSPGTYSGQLSSESAISTITFKNIDVIEEIDLSQLED